MKKILSFATIIALALSCSAVRERLAIKECKFSLNSVTAYDFTFSNFKIDFEIKAENPNNVDAMLDKLTYDFCVDETDIFSGTTGQSLQIPAGKSKNFATTITLNYSTIAETLLDAIRFQSAVYKVKARAYIKTIIGEISYPVDITVK